VLAELAVMRDAFGVLLLVGMVGASAAVAALVGHVLAGMK